MPGALRAIALLASVALASCDIGRDPNAPYLAFAGGGFIFNYRLAEAHYGFIAAVKRPLPDGALVRASFENPAGGPPLVVEHPVESGWLQYSFHSPTVRGIVAGRAYRVELSVVDRASGRALATYQRTFTSQADQAALPERAPVTGPGYHSAPARQP